MICAVRASPQSQWNFIAIQRLVQRFASRTSLYVTSKFVGWALALVLQTSIIVKLQGSSPIQITHSISPVDVYIDCWVDRRLLLVFFGAKLLLLRHWTRQVIVQKGTFIIIWSRNLRLNCLEFDIASLEDSLSFAYLLCSWSVQLNSLLSACTYSKEKLPKLDWLTYCAQSPL